MTVTKETSNLEIKSWDGTSISRSRRVPAPGHSIVTITIVIIIRGRRVVRELVPWRSINNKDDSSPRGRALTLTTATASLQNKA